MQSFSLCWWYFCSIWGQIRTFAICVYFAPAKRLKSDISGEKWRRIKRLSISSLLLLRAQDEEKANRKIKGWKEGSSKRFSCEWEAFSKHESGWAQRRQHGWIVDDWFFFYFLKKLASLKNRLYTWFSRVGTHKEVYFLVAKQLKITQTFYKKHNFC